VPPAGSRAAVGRPRGKRRCGFDVHRGVPAKNYVHHCPQGSRHARSDRTQLSHGHLSSRAKLRQVRSLKYAQEEASVLRTRLLPAHTRTAGACLSSARAPMAPSLAAPRWGSRPMSSLKCQRASVSCRVALWVHARCPTPAAVSPCRQDLQERASPAAIPVGGGVPSRSASHTCGRARAAAEWRRIHRTPTCSSKTTLLHGRLLH